jgi:hypothetical protein
VEIDAPAVAGTTNVTLPATSGEAIIKATDGSVDLGSVEIDASGRVGIGTTSPGSILHLQQPASAAVGPDLRLTNNAGTASDKARISFFGGTTSPTIRGALDFNINATGVGELIWSSGEASVTEKFRCDASGRLLVGTSSESGNAKHIVRGNTGSATGAGVLDIGLGTTRPGSAGTGLGYLRFTSTSNTGSNYHYAAIYAETDGTSSSDTDIPGRLVFSTTADGASSPSESLRINKDGIHYLPRNYNGNNSSVLTANVFIFSDGSIGRYTSSGKYKTEIEDLDDFYADKILELRPTWYRSLCKRDNPNWSTYGFIAEEVAEVDPRLVHWKTTDVVETENGGTQEVACEPEAEGVNYTMMIPHLVSIIKRQKQQIEAMEARLSALEGV